MCHNNGHVPITPELLDTLPAKLSWGFLTPWWRGAPFWLAYGCNFLKFCHPFGQHCWLPVIHLQGTTILVYAQYKLWPWLSPHQPILCGAQQLWGCVASCCATPSSACHASWLLHCLLSFSHCAALLLSCRTSWLLHCLLLSSRCVTLLSSLHASLLLHQLSLSSCCAAFVALSLDLDVPPPCHLVVSSCRPLVVLLCQLVIALSLFILLLRHSLILSLCRLVVSLPLLVPPSCPLVVPVIFTLPLPCHSPSPMPSNTIECCHHYWTPPLPPLNALCPLLPQLPSIVTVNRPNTHLHPSLPSKTDARCRHLSPLMSIAIFASPLTISSVTMQASIFIFGL